MATVPKVLFMEQIYICIFLLKFRHQNIIIDLLWGNLQHQADVTQREGEQERVLQRSQLIPGVFSSC